MMFMHVWITQEPRATVWLLGARVGLAAGCKREIWQGQLATLIQVWLQFHHIQPLAIIGHWAIGWLSVLCSTSPEFDSWSKDICPDHTAEPSGGFTPGNAMKSSVARLVSLNFGLCVCVCQALSIRVRSFFGTSSRGTVYPTEVSFCGSVHISEDAHNISEDAFRRTCERTVVFKPL